MEIFYMICGDFRASSYFAAYFCAEDETAAKIKAAKFEEIKYGKAKPGRSQKISYKVLNATQFGQQFKGCTYWRCYFAEKYGRVSDGIILATSPEEAITKFQELWPDKKVLSVRADRKRAIFWADSYEEPAEEQVTTAKTHPEQLAIAI